MTSKHVHWVEATHCLAVLLPVMSSPRQDMTGSQPVMGGDSPHDCQVEHPDMSSPREERTLTSCLLPVGGEERT